MVFTNRGPKKKKNRSENFRATITGRRETSTKKHSKCQFYHHMPQKGGKGETAWK